MQKDAIFGILMGLVVALIIGVGRSHATEIPLALADTEQSNGRPAWMQCSAILSDGSLANTELKLTPEGRILRPRTDYRMKFQLQPPIRGFWSSLAETLERRGVKFSLAPIPPRGLREGFSRWEPPGFSRRAGRVSWKQAMRHWQYLGVDIIDLLPVLGPLGEQTAFARDHHWSPNGARASALYVADKMSKEPILQGLPKETYILEGENILHTGSYTHQLNKNCPIKAPAEPMVHWSANWQSEDIFGEAPEPIIAIAGASNLNDEFAFVAHLQHALSLPIKNAGVSGGGFQHGILSILETPPDQPLPYWLLWVSPGYLGELFSRKDIHREILAAAQGRCTARNALDIQTAEMGVRDQSFRFRRPRENTGALYVQIAQPTDDEGEFLWPKMSKIHTGIHTDQGDRWKHTFRRKQNDLQFFSLPLPTLQNWQEIRISMDITNPAPATAYLCASPYQAQWPVSMRFALENPQAETVQ